MNETKVWYTSKGVWGTILMVIAIALGFFGYQFSPEDQAMLSNQIEPIVAIVGTILAIWGRVTASKTLTLTKQK